MKRTWLYVLAAVAVIGAFFVFTQPGPKAAKEKEPIVMGDTSFQTLWINNAIGRFIIENGYGYPTETREVTTSVLMQSLESGDIDLYMELWRNNLADWYKRVTKEGTVIDLGETYEKSTQGFYVPRYVIEGDPERGIKASAPDLKTVFDLEKYPQVFKDPEDPSKGRLVNCIIGWECQQINRIKLKAYGLDDKYNVQEPGSAAALDAAIAGAFKKGKPVLAYYWEPTWLVGTYDLVQLEEPKFTQECWDTIQSLIDKTDQVDVPKKAGCAYESIGIHKGIHKSLQDRAPEVVAFLKKMNVGTDALNKTAAFMQKQNVKADKAAIWFFENFQDKWRSWLPQDAEQRVEKALKDEGAKI